MKINYANCIDFDIRSTSDYILWFCVHMAKNNPSLLVRTVYIPLERSPYNTFDTFQTVHCEITDKLLINKHVLFIGDFNARTNLLLDYVPTDRNVTSFDEINNLFSKCLDDDDYSLHCLRWHCTKSSNCRVRVRGAPSIL